MPIDIKAEEIHVIKPLKVYLYQNILGFVFGGIFLISGAYTMWIFLFLIGLVIILNAYQDAWKNRDLDIQIKDWFKRFDNRMIIMYATNKKLQNKIRAHILPLFNTEYDEVYYEGPKIVTTFEVNKTLLNRMLGSEYYFHINNPSIYRIKDFEMVEIIDLSLYVGLVDLEIDIERVQLEMTKQGL